MNFPVSPTVKTHELIHDLEGGWASIDDVQKYIDEQFETTDGYLHATAVDAFLYAYDILPENIRWYFVLNNPRVARVIDKGSDLRCRGTFLNYCLDHGCYEPEVMFKEMFTDVFESYGDF